MYTKAGIQSLGLQTYNFNLSNWILHTLGLSVRGELATCASQESQSKWCISTSRIQATYTRDVQHRCFEWFLGLIIFTGIHIHVFNDFDHDVENIENPILGLVFDHVQLPGIHTRWLNQSEGFQDPPMKIEMNGVVSTPMISIYIYIYIDIILSDEDPWAPAILWNHVKTARIEPFPGWTNGCQMKIY